MHKTLLLAAYGWLTVFGLAHFLVDVGHPPSLFIAITAAIGWFLIAWLFMDYREPKAVAGIFFVLIAAAALTS